MLWAWVEGLETPCIHVCLFGLISGTGMGPVVFVYNPDDQSDTAQKSADDRSALNVMLMMCMVTLAGIQFGN